MKKTSVESIVRSLNEAKVRYLIVGGVAVNAHGYVRLTVDVDLIIGFDRANVLAAMNALKSLGYQARVPVSLEDFADAAKRQSWIDQKGMTVFSLYSPQHQETIVDIFVNDPLGFNQAYKNAKPYEIQLGLVAPICSLSDLLKLKSQAGRSKDKLDIEYLKKINQVP